MSKQIDTCIRARIATDKRVVSFYWFRDARDFVRRRRKRLYCYGRATFPLNPKDSVGLGLREKCQRSPVYLSDLRHLVMQLSSRCQISSKSIIRERVFLARVFDRVGGNGVCEIY